MCVCVCVYIYIQARARARARARVVAGLSWNFHPNPANRQSNAKHSTYQLLCIYTIPPDDGLQICPKHVEVDSRNELRINSASSWFLLHRCIEMHGQQNIETNRPVV